MKNAITLAMTAMIGLTSISIPQIAAAQTRHDYGSGDVCRAEQRQAANNGTAAGAIIGGSIGAGAARGNRVGGAILGGALGAIAGHAIGKSSVKCLDYPRRVSYHRNGCRWVSEYYDGRDHQFEVCRDRDGVWRPSGRG